MQDKVRRGVPGARALRQIEQSSVVFDDGVADGEEAGSMFYDFVTVRV